MTELKTNINKLYTSCSSTSDCSSAKNSIGEDANMCDIIDTFVVSTGGIEHDNDKYCVSSNDCQDDAAVFYLFNPFNPGETDIA